MPLFASDRFLIDTQENNFEKPGDRSGASSATVLRRQYSFILSESRVFVQERG
jgi:hypothetical protein